MHKRIHHSSAAHAQVLNAHMHRGHQGLRFLQGVTASDANGAKHSLLRHKLGAGGDSTKTFRSLASADEASCTAADSARHQMRRF